MNAGARHRRAGAIVLGALLAGCWTAAPPPQPAAPPARVGVGPRLVGDDDGRVEAIGLPAVAQDGSVVVFVETDRDGARGNPAVRLAARRRDDAVADALVVLDPNVDYEPAALRDRYAEANAWLARLQAAHPLVALAALPEPDATGAIADASIAIAWRGDTRDLTIALGGAPAVSTVTPASWLAAQATARCDNPAHLARAWWSAAAKLALLEIVYAGTDLCWEPPPRFHAIAW